MKTSRVSRDTARVVKATATTSRPPRRSLRSFQHAETSSVENVEPKNEDDGTPSSGLSSAPGSPEISKTATRATSGKRKRDAATEAISANKLVESKTRRSPRKAPRRSIKRGDDDDVKSAPAKTPRKPAKRISGTPPENEAIEPPAHWEEVYSLCKEFRKTLIAPVDTMGCESLAEDHRSPRDKRLQTLIALMLSSQTKDTVTAAAMSNLQQNLPGGFTLESLLTVEPEALNELIAKVGFHNHKTKYIKSTAALLASNFNSDIPDTIDGLISLPGVGPKMAYLTMSAAWGRTEGIGVDVHVHRITNLWGWHKTQKPEKTRLLLQGWLPRDKWHEINHLLVGLGQTVCLPVGRRCGECWLGQKGMCPSAVEGSPKKRRVKREVEIEVGGGEDETRGLKSEEVKVEVDDVGIKIEAESKEIGRVEVQAVAGASAGGLRDIEDV